jgi:hypothetical protein
MRITRTILAAALAAALAPALAADAPPPTPPAEQAAAREELRAAREELRTLTRRIAELSARLGPEAGSHAYAFRYLADADRAMIGIVLGADGDAVVLAGVTPGGPAEKAGLRAGDRIVAINGQRIDGARPGASGGLERALADDQRVEIARGLIGELEAGDKVRLTYERGGKPADVTIDAERRASWDWPMFAGNVELPPFEFALPHDFDKRVEVIVADSEHAAADARRAAERARDEMRRVQREVRRDVEHDAVREVRRVALLGGGFWNLRLAPLNPQLGKYFGSDQGVLVLENGGDVLPEIEAGDVILSIAGHKTESSSEAMRVLREQEPGSAVNIELLRQKKRRVQVVTAPRQRPFELLFPLPPEPPEPPTPPPAPQAPPTPPAPPQPPDPAQRVSGMHTLPRAAPLPPPPPAVTAPPAPAAAPVPPPPPPLAFLVI